MNGNDMREIKQLGEKGGLFQWNGPVTLGEVLPMGMQHVVAAVVSTVGPALMVSKNCGLDTATTTLLVQMALLMTAVSTFLMLFPVTRYVGSGLPVIMGVGFTIPTLMSKTFTLPQILGAQIIAGVVAILFGLLCAASSAWNLIRSIHKKEPKPPEKPGVHFRDHI